VPFDPQGPDPDPSDDAAERLVAPAASDGDPRPGTVRPGLAVVGSLMRLLRQLETTGQALEAYVTEAEAAAESGAQAEQQRADGP